MIDSSSAYFEQCFATFLCAGDETVPQLIGFIFLPGTGQRNKLCIRGPASTNKPDWLPLHIHVSLCRFIASWHNVRTINVSYVARLSHYRDSLTHCSFKYKMYTAQANKAFWVCGCPLWRDGGLRSLLLLWWAPHLYEEHMKLNAPRTCRRTDSQTELTFALKFDLYFG